MRYNVFSSLPVSTCSTQILCSILLFHHQVGDSVVRKGRETLERAIRMVETTPKWGARVVYGDTDRSVQAYVNLPVHSEKQQLLCQDPQLIISVPDLYKFSCVYLDFVVGCNDFFFFLQWNEFVFFF